MVESVSSSAQRFFTFFLIGFILIAFAATFAGQLQAQPDNQDHVQTTSTPSTTPTLTVTATTTPTATITPTATPTVTQITSHYLPILFTPALTSLPTPLRVTGDPPIDFDLARTEAKRQGRDISFNKIGFHVGIGGNREGLMDSITSLDSMGVPVFLKTANDAEPVYLTQELMKISGVPHILVYRDVAAGIHETDYSLTPEQAAQENWQLNKDVFPPELEPSLVWLETINEPDNARAAWLAKFSLVQAKLAVADGYKYAAFSWSGGEPTIESWELPEMLDFLRYAGDHPDDVAVALHEYSFETDYIASGDLPYPWTVGRFQKLFDICDKHGIPRPTILITEWGWEYDNVPSPDDAMEDIEWASWLYAAYPQVKGAAIWYLGEGVQFGSIHDQTQKLIAPVHDYSASSYFVIHPGQFPIDESLFIPNPPTSDNQ